MDLIDRISSAFPLSRPEVELIIRTAPLRYKLHFIEKRNGRGQRQIAQPTAELKLLQRWLVAEFVSNLPVHPAAVAYRPRLGIKDHARRHAVKRYLLKLDFRDFFPSILARDFHTHLAHHTELSLPDKHALTRLLFRLDRESNQMVLSIGAPSSPAVSNTVMYRFDSMVSDYCKDLRVEYTRYADDLAFSTDQPHVLDEIQNHVRQLCRAMEYPSLILNEEKSVFTSKKRQRQLTGLILTNEGKVSLGRDKKREIRAMTHHFSNGGLLAEDVSRLRGLLAFALSIEPEYVDSLIRMIGQQAYYSLMRPGQTTRPSDK